MSRAERRQYQRTMGRSRTPGPATPAGARRSAGPQRASAQRAAGGTARSAGDAGRAAEPPALDRRFWTWTLVGALAAGILLLSVSWEPAVRPASASLAWAAVGFFGWLAGAVGARLVRRRLARR